MAIRTSGSTNHVRRTANLPSSTSFTIFGRTRLVGDRTGTDRSLINVEDTTYPTPSSNQMSIVWRTDNSFNVEVQPGPVDGAFSKGPLVTDGSFFWALTNEGTGSGSLKGYWASDRMADLLTASIPGVGFTPNTFIVHSNTFDEWVDGELEYAVMSNRIWTLQELQKQRFQQRPWILDRLNCWGNFTGPNDLSDWSGQGRTWTAGGTLGAAMTSQVPYVSYPVNQRRLNNLAVAGTVFVDTVQAANDVRQNQLIAY